jgi:DNA-binding transcriptional regulator YiaG
VVTIIHRRLRVSTSHWLSAHDATNFRIEPQKGGNIVGVTHAAKFVSNTVRSNAKRAEVVQPVGIYVAPKADFMTGERNAEIKAIREREHGSQTVFAHYVNVSSSLVSKWERGEKRPYGASLKLLSLVEKNELATVA